MQTGNRVLVLFFGLALNGCASLYEQQAPAPVMGRTSGTGGYDPYWGSQNYPRQNVPPSPPVIETRPLEGINKTPEAIELKPELPPPTETPSGTFNTEPGEIPGSLPEQLPEQAPAADNPLPEEQLAGTEPETPPAAEQTLPEEAPQPAPAPAQEPEVFTPLEQFPPQTPAVNALVLAATDNSQAGNLDTAVSSIERAIRIEPRNAALYYKLAVLRLKQSKPRLAEDLARKAALLAVKDNTLKKHSWLLIANAREQQNNAAGASEAKAEAAKY